MDGGRAVLPLWLTEAKLEISASPEWLQLSEELLRVVRASLRAHGVGSFARLSDAEQRALVRSAAEAIRDTPRFRLFSATAWRLLDLHVDAEVATRVGSAQHAPSSKASLVETLSAEGCTALLSRLSADDASASCLGSLLGAQLPVPLRRAVWQRLLCKPTTAADFRQRCAGGQLAVFSARDAAIMHDARAILATVLPAVDTGGKDLTLLTRIKCALSYHDLLHPLASRDAYYWIVPLACALAPAAVGAHPLGSADEDLVVLVEAYGALLATPAPTLDADARTARRGPASASPSVPFDEVLGASDPELRAHLAALLNLNRDVAHDGGAPVATPSPHFDADGNVLQQVPTHALVAEAVARRFVGVFPMRTTLFAWDVCLLSAWKGLAPFVAAWLIALRAPLLEARTAAEARGALTRGSAALAAETLQRVMDQRDLTAKLRESVGLPLRAEFDHLAFGEPSAARPQRTTRYLDAIYAVPPPQPPGEQRSSPRAAQAAGRGRQPYRSPSRARANSGSDSDSDDASGSEDSDESSEGSDASSDDS